MLEINKLQKKYENFELNCSMKVEKGYITALVGENGAGKSTLMNILGLLDTCDSGTYMFSGWRRNHYLREKTFGANSERQSEDGNCFDRFGIQRIFKSKRYHTGDGVAIYRI